MKWDSDVDNAMSRHRADNQVRDQYDIMLEDCPLPRLWGISAFGTSMRVYRGERETFSLDPQAVPHSGWEDFTPTHLEGEWNTDILSQQGFGKMKEAVNDIVNSTRGWLLVGAHSWEPPLHICPCSVYHIDIFQCKLYFYLVGYPASWGRRPRQCHRGDGSRDPRTRTEQ